MAALVINIAEFKAEFKRKKSMTSYQRALEMAAEREERRRRECWRFWAGYERGVVGECQSSTEAAALAQIEAQAKARGWQPLERLTPITQIGMVDIVTAWREACAEHDAERAAGGRRWEPVRVVDRVVQWG